VERELTRYVSPMGIHKIAGLNVGYDYGQMSFGNEGADDDYSLLVDTAIGHQGIAQIETMFVVLSPHQWNPKTPLLVEITDSAEPDDLDDWDEAFEATLLVGSDEAFWYGSAPDGPQEKVGTPPGRYRALVTGRRFVAHGWPGTDPADEWRLRLTPTSDPTPARRLRAWAGPSSQ
jgi:hypothetical protein